MNKIYTVNYNFKQSGYQLHVIDRVNYQSLNGNGSDFIPVMIYTKTDQGADDTQKTMLVSTVSVPGEGDLVINPDINQEYHIIVILVYTWDAIQNIPISIQVNQLVADNNRLWQCLTAPPTQDPGVNSDWREITVDEIEAQLQFVVSSLKGDYYVYFNVPSNLDYDITVKEEGEHEFTVRWGGDKNIVAYEMTDFRGAVIKTVSGVSTKEINLSTPSDGLYLITMKDENGDYHNARIYDIYTSRKCYLKLLKEVICNCPDCEQGGEKCSDERYLRALEFTTMFQGIIDLAKNNEITIVNESITTINNEEYNEYMGTMIKKLYIMSNTCACS